jgi:hypothetical protein
VIDSEFQAEPSSQPPDFPWPPRAGAAPVEAIATTWQESVFHPASFFRRMPREFDFGWVLAYYLIVGVVVAGISLFWQMVLGPSLLERWLPAQAENVANPVVDFLLSPLWLLGGLYIAAGIVHLFLLLVGGAKHGFGPTLRVFCFSAGPQLFGVVPFIGPAVGGIWSVVITIIGLREAHETTTGKAAAALLIPLLLLAGLAVLLMIAAAVLGLGRAVV